MKLNEKTAHKLRLLAIDTRNCATDYSMNSDDEKWQARAGQLDRAADLLSEASRILDAALVKDGEF